ncbi:uba domain-containing protein ucp14 [Diaporthe amygdali]|uniref:uba domain-containing protein ucp14 n=1 Tax=Phomopsis amygdali TaxID=1214568 RepID=UPI0022FE9F8B|nr:uba domain-containing protein ucp14 [Diaporthe amygdali]KAJ0125338.1 uba domain-containing protein ucp14 [Diaporthe amygdali]
MSFTNAPVTRTLVVGLVSSSVAASLFDLKHYFYILVDTHIWKYHQPWRALIFQLCYTNSSEVLFAAMTLYNMRVVERMWGSRKYASFLVISGFLTSVLTPAAIVFLLRPLTGGLFNYLPAGPTPIIFAILAQYHAMIPHIYKYRMALTTSSPSTSDDAAGLTFSDKSYRYFLAMQLALFQWPGSILGAAIGWVVGYAWRNDLLPTKVTTWRLPGWMVGMRTQKRSQEFEGLRRRLEGENAPSATATGAQGQGADGDAGRRRTLGQQVLDQVSGAI